MNLRVASILARAAITATAVIAISACASRPTQVADLGGDAHSMTKRSTYLSGRPAELKTQVELEALAYCKAEGKALSVLDSRSFDPSPPEFASATVQFRCVAP